MARRSVEILMAESREAKKLLASLGALIGGSVGRAHEPEPSQTDSDQQPEKRMPDAD